LELNNTRERERERERSSKPSSSELKKLRTITQQSCAKEHHEPIYRAAAAL
jgi:hypothetical protein